MLLIKPFWELNLFDVYLEVEPGSIQSVISYSMHQLNFFIILSVQSLKHQNCMMRRGSLTHAVATVPVTEAGLAGFMISCYYFI